MGSDQLIELLSRVSYYLLPVAGLVLLVYLIIFFKNLIETLKTVNQTLKTTEEQIRKLDKPLDTVQDLSETVDKIHDASKGMIGKSIHIMKDGLDTMKEKFQKNKAEDEEIIIVEEVVQDEKK